MTKTCTGCFTDKPLSEFSSHHKNRCRACHSAAWALWQQDKKDREKFAEQVKLNRLINSIPRIFA